jgi:hypothetical protein
LGADSPIILVDGEAYEPDLSCTRDNPTYHPGSHSYTYTQGAKLSPHAAMSNAVGTEDLVPEQTEGFKVGEKKTIDEYQKLGESTIHQVDRRQHQHHIAIYK